MNHPERVRELVVLNTLAYPNFHWAVALFVAGLKLPLCALVYGERDRILPDVGTTMARLHSTWPRSILHSIPNAGHFVQEDRPEALAEILQAFVRRDGD